MSRTFRCKSTTPTGTIVRDGNPMVCFDENNVGFRSYRYKTTVWKYNLYGMTLTEIIEAARRGASIRRNLPRWTNKDWWYNPKRRRRGSKHSFMKRRRQRSSRRLDRIILNDIVVLGYDVDYNFCIRSNKGKY